MVLFRTNGERTAPLHILPCRVEHTGNVDGSKFHFEDVDGTLTASFRGRILSGTEIDLAKFGYAGFALHKSQQTNFEKMYVWNSGCAGDKSAVWERVAELLQMARAMGDD